MDRATLARLCDIAREVDSGARHGRDLGLTGISGPKLMACLHGFTAALCGKESVYLEIGVFQGLTLVSTAAENPAVACFGIDNFSLFDEDRRNLDIIRQRMEKLGVTNASVINRDFEDGLEGLGANLGARKIGVYLVDGAHDYRSQLVALLKARPHLADTCAIFVDDTNYGHVRQANVDFLRAHPEFALLFEAYTPGHTANLKNEELKQAVAGWRNGVNIMVRDPGCLIARRYPREEAKDIYFLSHDVFRHEFAEAAFPALKAAQVLLDGSTEERRTAVEELQSALRDHRRRHPGRFRHQNTASAGLPAFRLHA